MAEKTQKLRVSKLGEKLDRERVTIQTLKKKKDVREQVTLLSIYDYPFARLAEEAGLDIIIVGDSAAMTLHGHKNTLPITMDEMISHAQAVRRGTDNIFVVGDLPFMSYHSSNAEAVQNAGRFIKEGGCDAVKCETDLNLLSRIEAIADAGILVMGHIGLNPQKIYQMGGYRIQGKTVESYVELIEIALAVQKAGAFALLVEGVTEEVAEIIRESLYIPVYGIGSGRKVDGQLLIGHDLLGLFFGFKKQPIYIKQYLPAGDLIRKAFSDYITDVKTKKFPTKENVHGVKPEELKRMRGILKKKKHT